MGRHRAAGINCPSGLGSDLSDRLLPTEAIERLETGIASRSTLPSADAICWMRAAECRGLPSRPSPSTRSANDGCERLSFGICPTEDLGRQSEQAPYRAMRRECSGEHQRDVNRIGLTVAAVNLDWRG